MLAAAENAAAVVGHPAGVAIFSALHGLVPLTRRLAPYDMTITDNRSVTAATVAAQLDHDWPEVECLILLLPRRYRERLEQALTEQPNPQRHSHDLFAGTGGIGEQRARAATLKCDPASALRLQHR